MRNDRLVVWTRVRVRDFQDLNERYKPTLKSWGNLKLPHIFFMLEMKWMCWKLWTIVEIKWKHKPFYYKIKFDWMSISYDPRLYTREMLIIIPIIDSLE